MTSVAMTQLDCSDLPEYLWHSRAVAMALLDEAGRLVKANEGFRRILDLDDGVELPLDCARFFVTPRLADILATVPGDDGLVFAGILNLGAPDQTCRSLIGSVHRRDGQLLLVGEYDVAEMESLNAQVLSLNEQLAESQRELLRLNRRLQESELRERELSHTDPLTGLANLRKMEERMGDELVRSQRFAAPFSVILADIDHFKRVNDQYGHDIGDVILRRFAEQLRVNVRDCDLVARQGGEEFVILLPETPLTTAIEAAERLRAAVATMSSEPVSWPVTASFGVAAHVPGDDIQALIKRADTAMYAAKQDGRNRVAAVGDDVPTRLPARG